MVDSMNRVSLPGQNQQAEPPQNPGSQVLMDGEANCPGEPGDSLADFFSSRKAMRREDVVEQRVAAVFQGFNRCLFGEVMNVPVQFPTLQKPSLAQHRLYAEIQRNMEYLQFA